jgi:hypothetical protein
MEPIPASAIYDTWGYFRTAPIKTIEEIHGENFVRIFIYQNANNFFYGYQIKIGNMIKQKPANIKDISFADTDSTRIKACREIQSVCAANRSARKLIADFDKIRYTQPTLFEEDLYERCYKNGNRRSVEVWDFNKGFERKND